MSEPFIGTIVAFGFNFAPRGWATCQGQLMSIAQNTALFSLLGTTYGGNGQVTFGLPDFQGRVAMGQGNGPGLTPRVMGEEDGQESVTLIISQMPMHTHPLMASTNGPNDSIPSTTCYLGAPSASIYYNGSPDTSLNPGALGIQGGSQPHQNMQPTLCINYCIATEGIFPSRN
jgi:microcystin-dependent protein